MPLAFADAMVIAKMSEYFLVALVVIAPPEISFDAVAADQNVIHVAQECTSSRSHF